MRPLYTLFQELRLSTVWGHMLDALLLAGAYVKSDHHSTPFYALVLLRILGFCQFGISSVRVIQLLVFVEENE